MHLPFALQFPILPSRAILILYETNSYRQNSEYLIWLETDQEIIIPVSNKMSEVGCLKWISISLEYDRILMVEDWGILER